MKHWNKIKINKLLSKGKEKKIIDNLLLVAL